MPIVTGEQYTRLWNDEAVRHFDGTPTGQQLRNHADNLHAIHHAVGKQFGGFAGQVQVGVPFSEQEPLSVEHAQHATNYLVYNGIGVDLTNLTRDSAPQAMATISSHAARLDELHGALAVNPLVRIGNIVDVAVTSRTPVEAPSWLPAPVQ
jgi:hypothetical protein